MYLSLLAPGAGSYVKFDLGSVIINSVIAFYVQSQHVHALTSVLPTSQNGAEPFGHTMQVYHVSELTL